MSALCLVSRQKLRSEAVEKVTHIIANLKISPFMPRDEIPPRNRIISRNPHTCNRRCSRLS